MFSDPVITFRYAFRRSRVRVEILLVLLAFGAQSLPDLARLAGAHIDNARGALQGNGRRYRYEDALIFLGLVEEKEVDRVLVFELTETGRAAARRLREQVERRRSGRVLLRT